MVIDMALEFVFYDDDVGFNAYFSFGHIFFNTYSELLTFCNVELGEYELVQITDENYQSLVVSGVFANV